MKKALKKTLTLKDGTVFEKGTSFEISIKQEKPSVAVLSSSSFREVQIKSSSLHKYFPGFVVPGIEFTDPDFDSCIVPSLTGEMVEPDGWDEKGFPSILLSLGMI